MLNTASKPTNGLTAATNRETMQQAMDQLGVPNPKSLERPVRSPRVVEKARACWIQDCRWSMRGEEVKGSDSMWASNQTHELLSSSRAIRFEYRVFGTWTHN